MKLPPGTPEEKLKELYRLYEESRKVVIKGETWQLANNRVAHIAPEQIDLIADLVVERLSKRTM